MNTDPLPACFVCSKPASKKATATILAPGPERGSTSYPLCIECLARANGGDLSALGEAIVDDVSPDVLRRNVGRVVDLLKATTTCVGEFLRILDKHNRSCADPTCVWIEVAGFWRKTLSGWTAIQDNWTAIQDKQNNAADAAAPPDPSAN